MENHAKQWWALLGICLLAFTLFLDATIVSNALPTIQKALGTTNLELQWLISAFEVAMCACMALMGRLGDLFGLRKILYFSMALFGLASLAAGFSQTIHQLIFCRALQGIAAGSISITAALVMHNFSLALRAKAMSIYAILTGAGLALGPVAGGFLIDALNWRWVFWVNVPIVIVGILICAKTVREAEKTGQREKMDFLGAALLIIGISSLTITMTQMESWGWTSPLTIFGFLIGIIASIAFIRTELRQAQPLINFRLMNNLTFIPAAVTCLIFGLFVMTLLFLNPLYLQNILDQDVTTAGWLLFSISAMVMLTAPVAGWITHRFGSKTGTILVLLLVVISAAAHWAFNTNMELWKILLAFITFGAAWGIVNISPVMAVTATVDPKNSGTVVGSLWTFFMLGSSMGLAITGALFRRSEQQSFIHGLVSLKLPLNERLFSFVKSLLGEPQDIQQSLQDFSPGLAGQILPMFKNAFMHGFHSAVLFMLILSFLALLFVAFFMQEPKK